MSLRSDKLCNILFDAGSIIWAKITNKFRVSSEINLNETRSKSHSSSQAYIDVVSEQSEILGIKPYIADFANAKLTPLWPIS
jgi:hypothetical protein